MLNALQTRARKALQVAVAVTPWLLSMYALYWLEHGQVWTTETPHRGKITVTILALGMSLSFLLHSRFVARRSASGAGQ
jgi:hypothetical protein